MEECPHTGAGFSKAPDYSMCKWMLVVVAGL